MRVPSLPSLYEARARFERLFNNFKGSRFRGVRRREVAYPRILVGFGIRLRYDFSQFRFESDRVFRDATD